MDILKIAKKVLKRCNVIPKLRFNELISALVELNKNGSLSQTKSYEFPFLMHCFLSVNQLTLGNIENFDENDVCMEKLDHYIELLYDDIDDKIKGALNILNLVNKPENLKFLSKNDTLLCALSRVLREDGKKSLELAIYIVCIFCYFSNYTDFHYAVSNVSFTVLKKHKLISFKSTK